MPVVFSLPGNAKLCFPRHGGKLTPAAKIFHDSELVRPSHLLTRVPLFVCLFADDSRNESSCYSNYCFTLVKKPTFTSNFS